MNCSTMARSSTLLRCAKSNLARLIGLYVHCAQIPCFTTHRDNSVLRFLFQFWNLYELLDIWCFAKAIWTMGTYHELSMDVAEHVMFDRNQEHYYDMMASGGVRAAYRTMKVRQSDKQTDCVRQCGICCFVRDTSLNDVHTITQIASNAERLSTLMRRCGWP